MNQAIVQLVSASELANQDSHAELLMIDVIEGFTELQNSVHTQRSYKSDITGFFKALEVVFLADFGLVPYPQVVDQVNGFLKANTKTDEKTNRVLNAKTVNRKAYALSSFFNHLMLVYNYPKNPVRHIKPLKMEKRSTTTSLTRAEVIDFLAVAKGEHRRSETKFRNYLILILGV